MGFQLSFIELAIFCLYPQHVCNEILQSVKNILSRLFAFYVGFSTPPLNTQSHSSSSKDVESTNVANVSTSSGDNSIMLEFKKGKLAYGVHMKNELEKYLEELKEDRDNAVFKVLERWKVSSSKFKILSLLVQDVFSILLFTVASESVFSTG